MIRKKKFKEKIRVFAEGEVVCDICGFTSPTDKDIHPIS